MRILLVLAILCALSFLPAESAAAQISQPWQTPYTGQDVNGPHVIGFWRFDAEAPLSDASAQENRATLSGAKCVPDGKFGGGLTSESALPDLSKRHAAHISSRPELTPKGAFTIEMWIKPEAKLQPSESPVLIDKKYVANTDYQWRLSAAEKDGSRRMLVALGFGADSETYTSDRFVPTQEWQHVAFAYDGAGEVRFFLNGASLGNLRKAGRGAIAPGKHLLSIGDRVGSNYAGFPGTLDEVRLCAGALDFRPLKLDFALKRKTWLRMERMPEVPMTMSNIGAAIAGNILLRCWIDGIPGSEKEYRFEGLPMGDARECSYSFDTSLRPDAYRLRARIVVEGSPSYSSEESAEIVIAPRPLPHRMPVVMWGIYGAESVLRELPRLQDLGFNHCLGGGADMAAIWKAGKPIPPAKDETLAETRAMLDRALAQDFGIAFSLSPGHWLKERKELQRLDRNGRPYAPRSDVNASLPGLEDFCRNVGASVAQAYDAFPAWRAALINTEVRDSTQISFSQHDRDAYRKFAGTDIPENITNKRGVDWTKLPDFPKDRIIDDAHPVRKFMHWFWTVGDGWNGLHTAVHRGLHSTGRDDVWTWFDPAIRAPSVGGSGGQVDILGQWTYTNPDPVRIGYFTDELFAMAAASGGKARVMKMIQLFWYRSQTAPKKVGADHVASPFDDHDPDAAYITIAPLHLREAFWTMLSRPVSGIMYHGWQALVPSEGTSSYRHTHPDTKAEFRRLHREIVEPLGPTLLQVGDRPHDVAFLDSFTSQMFAGRGSYGYSSDEAYLTVLFAGLQPDVLFEETLLSGGLDRYRVLVLADCDVLTRSVAEHIRSFQARGGIVVGDERTAPAIRPDILLARVVRTKRGNDDKAALLAAATKLRTALAGRYHSYTASSNPEILVRRRAAGNADYVFAVNDNREYGSYVGQHGLVLDNGLPSKGVLSVGRKSGHVYDLLSQRLVESKPDGDRLAWKAALGPGEGGLFLITERPLAAVRIRSLDTIAVGETDELSIEVVDADGRPIDAVVPLRVEIFDSAGRQAERSGHYGAAGGRLTLRLDIARNDAPGVWSVRVRELASGLQTSTYLRVRQSSSAHTAAR